MAAVALLPEPALEARDGQSRHQPAGGQRPRRRAAPDDAARAARPAQGDPNGDAAWVAAQAASQIGEPTHDQHSYAEMTHNPPGAGTHGDHPYDEYKHQGAE